MSKETKTLGQRIDAIIEETAEIYAEARRVYPEANLPEKPVVKFNLVGTAAGMCQPNRVKKTVVLRYNVEAIEKDFDDMLYDTVPHEIAHAVCAFSTDPCIKDRGHGRNWTTVAKKLGSTGKRTHDVPLTKFRKVREWIYRTDDGQVRVLKTHRHNKIQKKGVTYTYNDGSTIGRSHFVREKK